MSDREALIEELIEELNELLEQQRENLDASEAMQQEINAAQESLDETIADMDTLAEVTEVFLCGGFLEKHVTDVKKACDAADEWREFSHNLPQESKDDGLKR